MLPLCLVKEKIMIVYNIDGDGNLVSGIYEDSLRSIKVPTYTPIYNNIANNTDRYSEFSRRMEVKELNIFRFIEGTDEYFIASDSRNVAKFILDTAILTTYRVKASITIPPEALKLYRGNFEKDLVQQIGIELHKNKLIKFKVEDLTHSDSFYYPHKILTAYL